MKHKKHKPTTPKKPRITAAQKAKSTVAKAPAQSVQPTQPPIPRWRRILFSRRVWVCFTLFLFTAWIAYQRYPVYLTQPNFYAEDGTVFAKTIMQHGFVSALITPFNGYFITGIYLLEGVAFALNNLFAHGDLFTLPSALAITSYAFWGFLCTLPLLLFWRDVTRKTWLVLLGLGLALMPMPGYAYAVLGTVGNYKFAFLFVAFLLLIKRMRLQPDNRWRYLLDAGLAVCAFTNATIYLLLPFALVPYWPGWKQLRATQTWRRLLCTPSFVNLVVLFGVVALQVVYVALRGGVDELQGYLQEPYQVGKTIEIFLHRTLLFPFDSTIAKHLNDGIVVVLTLLMVGIMWRCARREDRIVVVFGLYAALAATALFVSQRTGVSQFYSHYQSSGTDHFFYTQNFIIFFTAIYVMARAATHWRLRYQTGLLLALMLLLIADVAHTNFSANLHMNRLTGDFRYATQQACLNSKASTVNVPVYPVSAQVFAMDREPYCTDIKNYTPQREPLPLAPANNNYVQVNTAHITQTFVADYDNLNGISLFLSTFGNAGASTYHLAVLDPACKHPLRTTTFRVARNLDNDYQDVHFETLVHSRGNQYCFTVTPATLQQGVAPIALQFSAPNLYAPGAAAKNGTPLSDDIVFDLLYK